MNEHRGMMFLRVIAGKTVIFARDLIRIATTPVRSKDENVMRNGIDDLPQLTFTLAQLLLRPGALDCDARKM
jgi:hypothetical protein